MENQFANRSTPDAEKAGRVNQTVKEGDKPEVSDRDSGEFQGDVQRVRAITSSWSTKTLVLTFILSASHP